MADKEPPVRFKDPAEYTPDEWHEHQRTGAKPESAEYVAARRRALEGATLEATRPPVHPRTWTSGQRKITSTD